MVQVVEFQGQPEYPAQPAREERQIDILQPPPIRGVRPGDIEAVQ
jgi:hypothetical protein